MEISNVSEQKAEQTSGEADPLKAGPAVPAPSDTPQEQPVSALAPETKSESSDIESPKLVPEQDAAADTPMAETPEADVAKADEPKADAPHLAGRVMIMSSGDRAWGAGGEAEPEQVAEPSPGMFGKRRLAALAAVIALAALTGALGGALATAGLSHSSGAEAASAGSSALETSIARIDADILALKTSVEHTQKMSMSQFNKTSDRLDKVEKAQAEPAAKLAKLSEAVDKLRAAPQVAPAPQPAPVAAAPAAAKEVTGSIAPAAVATPAAPPKVEVARLPTVEGWVLRDVARGGALIEGRQGIYEVYAGDAIPGLGRIDAVRRQDGRWVVVTSKGLIVAR
jgi:hypothetical protein